METTQDLRTFRLTLSAHDAVPFREAMHFAGYEVEDTGERVLTDAEDEHVLLVRAPPEKCLTPVERIHSLLRA